MNRISLVRPAAMLLAVSIGAVPAFADPPHSRARESERSGGSPQSGRAVQSDRGGQPDRRAQAERGGQGDRGAQNERAAVPRASAPPPPRVERATPRASAPAPQGERAVPRTERREFPRADASRTAIPRVVAPRGAPQVIIRPRVTTVRPFYRPYYRFRPHVSLGYGLWIGYPVRYPFYYPYPVPYPVPYPYPDPSYGYPSTDPSYGYPSGSYPSGSVEVMPNNTGGLSFDISPDTAAVYVDGEYAGTVADFSPTMPPLVLTPGRHYIDIRAAGYEPILFDADVMVGQVIPYQGTMRRE